MRCLAQGLPGVGKSELIMWARRFFEEVMGWDHGVQYACVASMNTMAALIGGATIHSFGKVPVDSAKHAAQKAAKRGAEDISELLAVVARECS